MTMKRIDYLMQNEKDLNNMTYEEREITTSAKKLGEIWTKNVQADSSVPTLKELGIPMV